MCFKAPFSFPPRGALALVVWLGMGIAAACGDAGSPATTVARVTIRTGLQSLVAGDSVAMVATVFDNTNRAVPTVRPTWTTRDPSIATISASGVARGLRPGTTLVVASVATAAGARADSVSLVITPPAVASLSVEPAAFSLPAGDVRQLAITTRDAAGRPAQPRSLVFVSSNPQVATVSDSGRVLAIATGIATIVANADGQRDSAVVTVGPARVASITVEPGPVLMEIGEAVQLVATVRDARGQVITGRGITWSSDAPSVMISSDGVASGVGKGYATITATSEGVKGAIAATITDVSDYDYDLLYHRTRGTTTEVFTLTFGAGQDPVRINAGTAARTPTASPDGARIAFAVSMRDPGTGTLVDDIFAVDRVGTNSRRLTTAAGTDDQPTWSPAGGRIAYRHADDVSASGNPRSDIWVMHEDGTSPVNLTGDMPAAANRRSPAWSGDGQRLAFVQVETDASGTTTSIWIMRADGSGKQRVTSTTTGFDASPSWSPDGSRLVFVRYYSGDADLTILALATGVVRQLPMPGQQLAAAWSPLGDLIATHQVVSGQSQLVTLQPNGRRVQVRTVDPSWGGGAAPVWITKR